MLICWGRDDTWVPVDRAHSLAAAIPGARLRLLDGAGHLAQEDSPSELTAELTAFLAEGTDAAVGVDSARSV